MIGGLSHEEDLLATVPSYSTDDIDYTGVRLANPTIH